MKRTTVGAVIALLSFLGCGGGGGSSGGGGRGGGGGGGGTGGTGARVCVPGMSVACACTNGTQGAQVCAADGTIYGACMCSGGPGAAGSSGGVGAAGAGGTTGSAGTSAGGSGGTSGVAGTAGGGTTGSGGTGGGGSTGSAGTGGGGTTGSAGTGGKGGGSGGSAGSSRGGTTGGAGSGGVAGTSGTTGTGVGGACIGAANETGRGPALVTIPGGTFTFSGNGVSLPVDGFRMDKTLVTAAQFRACVEAGCCTLIQPPETCQTNYSAGTNSSFPMNCVSLAEASAFCAWAGKEIPTEEQWEFAAGGPGATRRSFPWGNLSPLYMNSKLVDPSPVCSTQEVTPAPPNGCAVATHSPAGDTPEGLQDMAGNMREWTTNCDNVTCVVRGSAAQDTNWSTTNKNSTGIQSHVNFIGFRCVRSGGVGNGTGGAGGSSETRTIEEFPIAGSPQIWDITGGADGNVWFTELGSNNIGRITPAGVITEFPLPNADTRPRGIALGSDNNIWYVGARVGAVGWVTPAGVITENDVPQINTAENITRGSTLETSMYISFGNALAQIAGTGTAKGNWTMMYSSLGFNSVTSMVAGPDRNIWFAAHTSTDEEIIRITPTGSLNAMYFPIAGAVGINGVTVGPDNNIWFTTNTDRIGRITVNQGVLTRFPLPNPGALPYDITTGPDGNLWFTENSGNKIGRMTPTGTVTEFPIPTANSGPRSITVGPDGKIWFVEYTANKIGRLTP